VVASIVAQFGAADDVNEKAAKAARSRPVVILAVAEAVIAVIHVKEPRYSLTSRALRHRPVTGSRYCSASLRERTAAPGMGCARPRPTPGPRWSVARRRSSRAVDFGVYRSCSG
jgi:hypothetical protein